MPMDAETRARLRAAAKAATPGPWDHAHRGQRDGNWRTQVFDGSGETIATLHWYPRDLGNGILGTYRAENATFIAAANPAAALALLAALDRAEAERDDARREAEGYLAALQAIQSDPRNVLHGTPYGDGTDA